MQKIIKFNFSIHFEKPCQSDWWVFTGIYRSNHEHCFWMILFIKITLVSEKWWRSDLRTDRRSYRDAIPHLKTRRHKRLKCPGSHWSKSCISDLLLVGWFPQQLRLIFTIYNPGVHRRNNTWILLWTLSFYGLILINQFPKTMRLLPIYFLYQIIVLFTRPDRSMMSILLHLHLHLHLIAFATNIDWLEISKSCSI